MKCNELKAFDITVAEEGYCEGIVKYRRAVYDKSEADKVIARHKYKRCLAMVRWCASRSVVWDIDGNEKKSDWYWKWKERWKELAEKFKEAK